MSDHLRHHRSGRIVRKHRGMGWLDTADRHIPAAILAACERAEADLFGLDDHGTQAVNQRRARAIAALLEFSGLRVADAARLVGVDPSAAWYMRRKWAAAVAAHRDEWIGRVEAELTAPPIA